MTLIEQKTVAEQLLVLHGFCSSYQHGGIHEYIDCTQNGDKTNFKSLLPFFSCYYGSSCIEEFTYHLFAYEDSTLLHYLIVKCPMYRDWRLVLPSLAYELALKLRYADPDIRTAQDMIQVAESVASRLTTALSFYFVSAATTVLTVGSRNDMVFQKYLNHCKQHRLQLCELSTMSRYPTKAIDMLPNMFRYHVTDQSLLLVWRA